jgi:alpha/beta superfamily hydrolase
VAPPANVYDFSFLAPCPSSGLIIQGDQDTVVPQEAVGKLIQKLSHQRGIKIDYKVIAGATHFFNEHHDQLAGAVDDYLETAIPEAAAKARSAR